MALSTKKEGNVVTQLASATELPRMVRVRQKLDALCPGVHWIETVRRKGYRFNSGARA